MKLHDDIHNYYEKLVVDHIVSRKLDAVYDDDVMADFVVLCSINYQLDTFATMLIWSFTCHNRNVWKWKPQ